MPYEEYDDDCGYDEDYYEEDDYREFDYDWVNESDRNPIFRFYKTKNDIENPLYMGFELEIDEGGQDDDVAYEICSQLNNKVYCKSDGSLNEGIEIVSHPSTLNFHTEQKETYKKLFDYLIDENYRSHDTTTCGLHIHVNRNFFGSNTTEIDLNVAKILFLFEKYWDNFAKFSRRSEEKLNKWAKRYNLDIDENLSDNLTKAKRTYERYYAINLQNEHTVEFRMFRGTLNVDTFMATLQLIDCICNFVKTTDIEKLQQTCFERIVKSNFKELNEYLQKKNLKEILKVPYFLEEELCT